MAKSKFQLYKNIKIGGKWRFCRAAVFANNKLKPHVVVVAGREETHPEGTYYARHKNQWIAVGTDPLDAQRMRSKLLDTDCPPVHVSSPDRTPLTDARDGYFTRLEARGLDPKTLVAYRSAVDPFVANCKKFCVEEVNADDMYVFMGWLRKQPKRARRDANPEHTYSTKLRYVAIFLKAFGVSRLLKAHEYPQYEEKKIVAHTDEELALLYSHADADETFLLDFFLGTMVRDQEAYNCKYTDLTGTTLTVHGKRRKIRTVEISPRLADAIQERRKHSKYSLLFPTRAGNPDEHLLDMLQSLAKRAGATFHTELHELRKTGASRRYLAGVPLATLMLELGHKSLDTTRIYLADVRKEEEVRRAVADADFVMKPMLVKKVK